MCPVHRNRRVLPTVCEFGLTASDDDEGKCCGEKEESIDIIPVAVDAWNDRACRLPTPIIAEQNDGRYGQQNQVGQRCEELADCVRLLDASVVE